MSCIPHTGCVDKDGYGWISVGGRARRAHRVAWEKANGRPVPHGVWVLHSCDNPVCVNPDHLRLGTHQENVADKVNRSRQSRGESSGSTKLTERDVVAIRGLHAIGDMSLREIGDMFGLSKCGVWNIVTKKTWKHV